MKLRSLYYALERYPENVRTLIFTGICGTVAGLAAVAFLILTRRAFALTYLAFAKLSVNHFLLLSFVTITLSSIIVGLLVSYLSKDAAGSGVPQLKAAYWNDLGVVRWRTTWVRFVAGVFSIGGGASLGREGPTVYVAGGCASYVAGWLGAPRQRRRQAVSVGAAAGLAAAFNTPLAAITFVLEELIGDMNSRFLGSAVLASVLGAFVVYWCIGKQPAFSLPDVQWPSWHIYLLVPLVAALAAFAGVIFQKLALQLRGHVRYRSRVPGWLRPLAGGLIVWAVGGAVFALTGKVGVFGLGYDDLSDALNGLFNWKVAGLLMAAKLVATICCYGWEGSGGIFAPTLVIGGMCGLFTAGGMAHWFSVSLSEQVMLAAVGMSACFGAVVRAPLTALLMIFEMTHQFSMVPALMIGTIVSQAVARLTGATNFYDSLLVQDGHELIKIRPPRDFETWQNLPVSSIVNARPVVIRDLSEDSLQLTLLHNPYRCFPVMKDEIPSGTVTRQEIETALRDHREPVLDPAVTCLHGDPLRLVQDKFLRSPSGLIVVLNQEGNKLQGVLTLHDLLRAQASQLE